MGIIVAIGGGEIKNLETLAIDREIARLTGKRRPRALFIPTASGEPEGYIKTFHKVYGKKLGCKTDVLYLLKERPSKKEIKRKIISADLVYVGGGNTLKMMKRWRFLGVDKLLREAYRRGAVLSGISAGAICWFDFGHSDSMRFYRPKSWDYIAVRGLGLIRGTVCPHFAGRRKDKFLKFMKGCQGIGIGIGNNCAIEVVNGGYRVISSKPRAGAYRIYKKKGAVRIDCLENKKAYFPIKNLYIA